MYESRSVYPSKIDFWVAGLLAASLLVSLFAVFQLLRSGTPEDLFGAVFTLAVLACAGVVAIPVRYIVGSDELVVQSGIWKTRVPLASIRRVYPSRSLIASPALSMDRLGVEYRKDRHSRPTLYLSPARKEEFLRELAAAAGLEPRGAELVRPQAPAG